MDVTSFHEVSRKSSACAAKKKGKKRNSKDHGQKYAPKLEENNPNNKDPPLGLMSAAYLRMGQTPCPL